jgi:hypothetical protein
MVITDELKDYILENADFNINDEGYLSNICFNFTIPLDNEFKEELLNWNKNLLGKSFFKYSQIDILKDVGPIMISEEDNIVYFNAEIYHEKISDSTMFKKLDLPKKLEALEKWKIEQDKDRIIEKVVKETSNYPNGLVRDALIEWYGIKSEIEPCNKNGENMAKIYDGDTLEEERCCKLDTDVDGDCPIHKEKDPFGKDAHSLGSKLDDGKVRVSLLFNDFPRALLEVAKISTFGAKKYTAHGWISVPNGIERYDDAKDRHILYGAMEANDPDSGLLHAAHEAWNVLAKLELMLREIDIDKKEK